MAVVIRLLGLAVIRLIDWAWWGATGRGGLAGAAWHIKEAVRRPSLPLAWLGSHRRGTEHAPQALAVTLLAGCALLCGSLPERIPNATVPLAGEMGVLERVSTGLLAMQVGLDGARDAHGGRSALIRLTIAQLDGARPQSASMSS